MTNLSAMTLLEMMSGIVDQYNRNETFDEVKLSTLGNMIEFYFMDLRMKELLDEE